MFEQEIAKYYVMDPKEDAMRSSRYLEERELIHACLGLAGETGELIDLIKKSVNYGSPLSPLDKGKLLNEAGDVIHYLARILSQNGFTLEDAKAANLAKLSKRYPNGYSNKAAITKRDQVK